MRPDLRLGGGGTPAGTPYAANGGLVVRHAVQTSTAAFTLTLVSPPSMSRRAVGDAIADAVAEMRALDLTYGPLRSGSLVSRLRRGEVTPEAYPPLADLVARCDVDARRHGRLVRRLGGARGLRPQRAGQGLGRGTGRRAGACRGHQRLRGGQRR